MAAESDDDQKKSVKVKSLIIGAACLIAALSIWLFFVGETTLVCDRSEEQCVLTKTTAISGDEGVVDFGQIKGARVVKDYSQADPHRPVYDAVLDTDEGSGVVSHIPSSSEDKQQAVVDRINDFLDDPDEQRLEVHDDGGTVFNAMPLVFLISGLFLLFHGRPKE